MARYQFLRAICLGPLQIPSGATQINVKLLDGVRPITVLCMFCTAASTTVTDYERNPFNFMHLNVTEAFLKFENQEIPPAKFDIDFDRSSTIELYDEFQRTCQNLYKNASANGYTYQRFKDGGTIYPFKCDPHPYNPDVTNSRPTGSLTAHFRLKSPTTEAINLYYMCFYQNTVGIDYLRNVSLDYIPGCPS
uniref:Uncharacterized protein n=1 Tax=Plectus sambesii TaxID=2011161 RepID=A0A914WL51_9BILA